MRKLAFLFPGGGAQSVGMMKDICCIYPEAQRVFDEADRILGRSISDLTFTGNDEELALIHNMQPCMLTAEIAALMVLNSLGIRASMTAGFSLGEWSSLVAADTLSFEESLRLSQLRADYMKEAVQLGAGGMAVIFGESEMEVLEICRKLGGISPSNFNCPGQITVSGKMSSIKKLMEMKERDEIAAYQVPVDIPSHCELMRSASEKLALDIEKVAFRTPNIPIVQNVTAKPTTSPDTIKKNLLTQLVKPVRFQQSIEFMLNSGIDTFIEVGPGDALSRFIPLISKHAKTKAIALNANNIETLNATLEYLES